MGTIFSDWVLLRIDKNFPKQSYGHKFHFPGTITIDHKVHSSDTINKGQKLRSPGTINKGEKFRSGY